MRCFCLDSNGQWLVSLFVTVVKILLSKAPGSGSIAYNQLCHRHHAQYRDGGEELNDGIIGSTKAMLVAFDPIGALSRGRAGNGRARGKKNHSQIQLRDMIESNKSQGEVGRSIQTSPIKLRK